MKKGPFTRAAWQKDDSIYHSKKNVPSIFYAHADMDFSVKSATNSMPVYMQRVKCSGRELSLLGCSYGRNLTHIDHSRDVAVKCKKCKKI